MTNEYNKDLQNLSIETLILAYSYNEKQKIYHCLSCGDEFEKGQIYTLDNKLYEAKKACETHIKSQHPDWFNQLLNMAKDVGSFSDIQADIIARIYKGQKDKDIARDLGGKSPSTIRNHRFQLRAREKEARFFLAVMELLNQRSEHMSEYIQFHPDLPVDDDRILVTEEEEKEILAKHLSETPHLKLHKFPKKQKHKLIILKRIAQIFDKEKVYTEKEINYKLTEVYFDYVTIRRYLIEYVFLKRKADGSEYWKSS